MDTQYLKSQAILLRKKQEKEYKRKQVQEANKKEGWIPITELLPNKKGLYIVSRESGEVNTSFYFEEEKSFKEGYNSKVVAWQSLPNKYI
jgi:hypothetical protein